MLTQPLLTRLLTGAKPGGPRSPHWPAVRARWLKDHPACAACGGVKFLEVHHKRPFHLFPALELAPENFLTLCELPARNCHFTWGHFYDWSLFNPDVVADTATWLAKVNVARPHS